MTAPEPTARPCVAHYGPHESHGLDCATPAEWDAASAAYRAATSRPASAVRCPGCGRAACPRPRLECGGEGKPALQGLRPHFVILDEATTLDLRAPLEGVLDRVRRTLVEAEERHYREGLQALGWLPPDEALALRHRADRYAAAIRDADERIARARSHLGRYDVLGARAALDGEAA